MTREKLLKTRINDAVQAAFQVGSIRVSNGSSRPTLSNEDCQHIAEVAHRSVETTNLGIYGLRTIHGGRR